ncbi:hypothetical protein EJB05_33266, partial [Eragrostis curvula]
MTVFSRSSTSPSFSQSAPPPTPSPASSSTAAAHISSLSRAPSSFLSIDGRWRNRSRGQPVDLGGAFPSLFHPRSCSGPLRREGMDGDDPSICAPRPLRRRLDPAACGSRAAVPPSLVQPSAAAASSLSHPEVRPLCHGGKGDCAPLQQTLPPPPTQSCTGKEIASSEFRIIIAEMLDISMEASWCSVDATSSLLVNLTFPLTPLIITSSNPSGASACSSIPGKPATILQSNLPRWTHFPNACNMKGPSFQDTEIHYETKFGPFLYWNK